MTIRHKRGDVHPVTGKLFEGYNSGSVSGENWITPEKFALRTKNAREKRKLFYWSNPDRARAKNTEWSRKNPDKRKAYNKKAGEKRRSSPMGRLICNMRSRVSGLLSGAYKQMKKDNPLGCNREELKLYLEKHFCEGMNWGNYGKAQGCWSLDHTIPLSSAESEEELFRLLHHTNLRPMWHIENIRKNNRFTKDL